MRAAQHFPVIRLGLLALVLVNCVQPAAAQVEPDSQRVVTYIDLTGTWESLQWNLDSWILELKTSRTTLTGTVSLIPGPERPFSGDGRPMEIYDGKIDKDRVEFKVKSPDTMRVIVFSAIATPGGSGLRFTRKVEILQVGGSPGGDDIFGAAGPSSFVAKQIPTLSRRSRNIIQ